MLRSYTISGHRELVNSTVLLYLTQTWNGSINRDLDIKRNVHCYGYIQIQNIYDVKICVVVLPIFEISLYIFHQWFSWTSLASPVCILKHNHKYFQSFKIDYIFVFVIPFSFLFYLWVYLNFFIFYLLDCLLGFCNSL